MKRLEKILEKVKPNLENICRICLTGRRYLKNIHKTKIPKMLKDCGFLKISKTDGLPNKICRSCFQAIKNVYIFKKNLEYNSRILRQIVLNEKCILNTLENVGPVTKSHGTMFNEEPNKAKKNEVNSENFEIVNTLTTQHVYLFQKCTIDIPPLIPIQEAHMPGTVSNLNQDLPQAAPPLVPLKQGSQKLGNDIPTLEYKCFICNENFKDVTLLKKHTLKPCKKKDLQCSICQKEFNERKKLVNHLKGHTVVKNYLCKVCGKRYPTPSTFSVHMRSHTGERPFKCNICNKGFVRWAGVNVHMKTHEDKRPFSCLICQRGFKVQSNLARHMRIHLEVESHTCTHCQKSFSQLHNLRTHIRTFHTNERPFLCNICGKSYATSNRLKRHMWSHSEYKPFKCKICPKSYIHHTDLLNHECCHRGNNVDDLKKYSCEKCGLKFFYRCRLIRHQIIHEKCTKRNDCINTSKPSEHLVLDHGVGLPMEETILKSEELEIPIKKV